MWRSLTVRNNSLKFMYYIHVIYKLDASLMLYLYYYIIDALKYKYR